MADESRPVRTLARRSKADAAEWHAPTNRAPLNGGSGMEGDVRKFIDILRRRFTWVWGIFLAVVAIALLGTVLKSPVYRATALLEIRRGDGDVPSIAGLFADGDPSDEYLRTQLELLQSATLAQRVILNLRLDQHEEFAQDEDAPPQAIVEGFRRRLVLDPVASSRLVRVTFDAGSAELSARIVNEVVASYGELRNEARVQAAERLTAQVVGVEESLAESEEKLRAYTQANDLPYLVEEDLTAEIGTRLRDLRARFAQAEGVRQENQALYEVIRGEGRVDIIEDAALRDLEAQLSGLRREYGRLSATFTDDFPATAEVLRQIENVRELIGEEQDRVAGRVASDFRLSVQREGMIAEAIDQQEDRANLLGPESGNHHVLRQAVLANRALYVALHERQRDAETAVAIGPTDFSVIDPAVPPTQPHSPVFGMNLGLAIMLGLVLGVGGAFAREVMDDTVQNATDLPTRTNVHVLGMIPSHETHPTPTLVGRLPGSATRLAARSRRPTSLLEASPWLRIDALKNGGMNNNAVVDAFGALRTAVLFRNGGPLPRTILVTSCRAGEGKTTVSLNLAMSLAKLGRRVLLIDADLRRPSLHLALGLPSGPGLVNYLSQDVHWKRLVQVGVVEGLDVLRSGGATTHAADLLANRRVRLLLREAETQYDHVIVDAPALFINAPDATLLSREMDGVVVVVRSRSTPKALVDRIPGEVPNLLGVVVNDLQKNSMPDFGDYFAEYGDMDGEILTERGA
jgi:capsular exopolysaccharide synthesis family protein